MKPKITEVLAIIALLAIMAATALSKIMALRQPVW